jgi:hypothetical protein
MGSKYSVNLYSPGSIVQLYYMLYQRLIKQKIEAHYPQPQ